MNGENGLIIGEKPFAAWLKALSFRSGKGQKGKVQQNENRLSLF